MPEGRLRPRELTPIDEFRFERITGRPARFRIGNGIRDKKRWHRSAPVVTRRRGSNFLISGPRRNRMTKLGAAAASQPGFSWTLDFPDAGPICFQVS